MESKKKINKIKNGKKQWKKERQERGKEGTKKKEEIQEKKPFPRSFCS